MKLTSEKVSEIFIDCLFKEGEPTEDMVPVEGIKINIGFHPERLECHSDEITELLNELPEEFHSRNGGGWSFLNACNDRHGNQWTGLHQVMEQLVMLGVGIKKVKYLMPRNMWDVFPDGMPYFVIG